MNYESTTYNRRFSIFGGGFLFKSFKRRISDSIFKHLDFEEHLPRMIHFWSFVLLDEPGYTTNVVEKHLNMPLEPIHFQRWLALFNETIDELFDGEKVEVAKQRAAIIAWTIESKLKK